MNTDDPELLSTSLVDEYEACEALFAWTRDDLVELARTSIEASFAPEPLRLSLLDELAAFAAAERSS